MNLKSLSGAGVLFACEVCRSNIQNISVMEDYCVGATACLVSFMIAYSNPSTHPSHCFHLVRVLCQEF